MFKKYLIAILSTSLLLGCDFRPSTKVIEYQEEVKLSDGSMIWVDIKRHYRLAGEPFQKKNYLPSIVEISWDTGFPNVGRQSVIFGGIITIEKFHNTWYVGGGVNDIKIKRGCSSLGVHLENSLQCVIILNNKGFLKSIDENISADIKKLKQNIFYTGKVKGWEYEGFHIPPLNGRKLTWSDKIALTQKQDPDYAFLNQIWQK